MYILSYILNVCIKLILNKYITLVLMILALIKLDINCTASSLQLITYHI